MTFLCLSDKHRNMVRLGRGIGTILLAVWELPQNVLGLLVFTVLRSRSSGCIRERGRLFVQTRTIGVSLGWFVFWCADESLRLHEYGHSIQSRLLGPLYLLLIGLPSVLNSLVARVHFRRTGEWDPRYFDRYPENWADHIAGVDNRGRRSVL